MIVLPFPPASLSGHAKGWTQQDNCLLREGYASGLGAEDLGRTLGRTRSAIRNQAYKLKITSRDDEWTEAELCILREWYAGEKKRGELLLDDLAQKLGRHKSGVCRKARVLGLTNTARKGVRKPKIDRRKYKTNDERSAARSAALRQRHKTTTHPMLGKSHSAEVREVLSAKSNAAWAAKSQAERSEIRFRALKTRVANQGTAVSPRPHASWKAGWREVGGRRIYFRSRWEANYARYLEWLKQQGQIRDWQHEPETFWFDAIKRGVRSYLPDFRVWENDGSKPLHEVKGWMDARSKTTLKRMAKYHPQERVLVIREKAYNDIARKVGRMIEGWESGGRADRP